MPSAFPPTPVYPLSIDSDRTLFLVFNTSESSITKENSAWADEIEIVPSKAWADNGYANINGELFYYDAVVRNSNGEVTKFRRCARNLGGTKTQNNKAGTKVRGFVVAEHHNQLVDVILNVENFIGIDFSDVRETLDYRIRHIAAEGNCLDDHTCPDVNFSYEVISTDNCNGTLISYATDIAGIFTNFRIDFGDNSSTTTAQVGTHLYPPNSKIDPVIVVSNDFCQIVQTPILRESTEEPAKNEPAEPFLIPVIVGVDFPPIIVPECQLAEIPFTWPQLAVPCFNLGDVGLPSLIVVDPPINIPSLIEFGPVPSFAPIQVEVPSIPPIQIQFPSTIDIGPISIPPIQFGPIPSFAPIQIEVPSIPPIQFGSFPSIPAIEFGDVPSIQVNWGTPPTVPVKIQCPGTNARSRNFKKGRRKNWKSKLDSLSMIEEGIEEEEEEAPVIEIETEIGIPSEIKVIQEIPIPRKIDIVFPKLEIDPTTLPTLKIEMPKEFPSIKIEGMPTSLRVEGIPDIIHVTSEIPKEITALLKAPEGLEIPLVYKGPPVPMKFDSGVEGTDDQQCFKLVPCKP